jgi:uncharacterized protein (DUF2164 family)
VILFKFKKSINMGKARNQTKIKAQLTAEEEEKRRQQKFANQLAANKFDKIIKENAPDSIPKVIEIATQLRMISWEDYPHEVQYTLERRPDFLKKVIEEDGKPAIWHGEYQVPDEKKMIFRLLVYCGLFKRREGNILVRQFVIYLGTDAPVMQTEIHERDLFFRFQLIPIIDIPYELLLESGEPQEAILAMLGNFHGEKPEKVIQKVVQTIAKNTENELDKQRHFQQLQVMGQLRNFEPIIDTIMESENLQEYVSIERTWFYKQGVKASNAKYEKLLSEAEQRQHDLEQKQERFIAALLLEDAKDKDKVALLVDVPLQTVEEVSVKITKTRTLLMTNILTWEEIAAKIQVSLDFVKTVANASIGKV